MIKDNMSFMALRRGKEEEGAGCNPINRINRGFRKAKNNPCTPKLPTQQPPQPSPQLSFSSLSKNKHPMTSEKKLKRGHSKQSGSQFMRKKSSKQDGQIASVRKRLDFDTSLRQQSKENKLNFSNIIRKSKEKSLKSSSLLKKSHQKLIKPPIKKTQTLFNKLKTRLIGNQEGTPSKSSFTAGVPIQMDMEMVRISMQVSVRQEQLNMEPSL